MLLEPAPYYCHASIVLFIFQITCITFQALKSHEHRDEADRDDHYRYERQFSGSGRSLLKEEECVICIGKLGSSVPRVAGQESQ